MSPTIDIYVSGGQQTSSPFYTFYIDDAGTQEFTSHLKIGTTYTFHRLNSATSHPFYISDQGYELSSTASISLSGDGNASSGITGSETLTLVINSNVSNLYYYCTIHDDMISEFSVSWQPQDKDELQNAVNLWISDNATALTNYGNISTWDTSQITDMSNLFKNKDTFNDDISSWDVSSVTNTMGMFWNASSFNGNISSWDVSNVTNTRSMFSGASSFNGNISSWDTSQITDMFAMFYLAASFNGNISSWDVSSVTNMRYIFADATAFKIANPDINDDGDDYFVGPGPTTLFTSTPVTTATEDSTYTYTVTSSDAGATFEVTSPETLPSWLSFDSDTGVLSGTPLNSDVGPLDVTIQLTSSSGTTEDQTFTISVASFNDLPVITSTEVTEVVEGSPYSYTVTANDEEDGANVTLTAHTLPTSGWLLFDAASGVLSGTPDASDVGDNDVVIVVADSDPTNVTNHEFTIIVHALPTVTISAMDSAGDVLANNGYTNSGPIDITFRTSGTSSGSDLFFSGYCEGSGNNKYLQIYNPTDQMVDLSNYAFPSVSNAPSISGKYEYWNAFLTGATIAPGEVYVLAHGSSHSDILNHKDQTHIFLSNGDDGYKLVKIKNSSARFTAANIAGANASPRGVKISDLSEPPEEGIDFVVLDTLGDFQGDPGAGWEVAGVTNGTKEHTLLRKSSITNGNADWNASRGTNTTDSEWEVYAQNTFTYVGEWTPSSSSSSYGLSSDSITVTGGSLNGTFSGSGTTYTATFTPAGTDPFVQACTIDVNQGAFPGTYGNSKAASFSFTYDTASPTMTISAAEVSNNEASNHDSLSLTFTSNEAITNFASGDINVTNGTLSNFASSSDTVYTATFTPSGDGACDIVVDPSVFEDMAKNLNLLAATPNQFNNPFYWTHFSTFTPNTKAELQAAIAKHLSGNDLYYGLPNTWNTSLITDMSDLFSTVTNASAFNHDISGWDVSNVTNFTNMFAGDTYSNVSVNNKYPGTYWTHANVKSVSGMVTFNVVLQATAPVITISGDVSHERGTAYTDAGASAVNYMGSDISSYIVVSGDVVDPSVVGNYTITYNVTDPLSGLTAAQVSRTVIVQDTTQPTVTSFTMSDSALKSGDTSTVTLVFSEAVASFSSTSDITVANGSLPEMITTDNITWTGTYTPNANVEVATNVLTLANTYTDIEGIVGPSADTANYTVDTISPTIIVETTVDADNTYVAVTFSEAVFNAAGGSGALEASDFALSISSGTASLLSATPSSISISGNIYTLGLPLTGTPNGNETLTVNPVADSIYDAAGNVASTSQSNNTVNLNDKIVPTISETTVAADNTSVAVTFSESVFNDVGGSGALEASDFALSISGGSATLSSTTLISSSGNVYTLGFSLTGTPDGNETLTVNPVADSIYDAAGNVASTSQSNNTVNFNVREAIQINMNNKTYYIVNHMDMTKNQYDTVESILSDLFNETKSNMNVINDSDMTTIFNAVVQQYSSTGDSTGNFLPLVQTFTSDDNLYYDYVFVYHLGINPSIILSYWSPDGEIGAPFSNTWTGTQIDANGNFWGLPDAAEVRNPTTDNRAYYYVFEGTLKSSAYVSIVGTINI